MPLAEMISTPIINGTYQSQIQTQTMADPLVSIMPEVFYSRSKPRCHISARERTNRQTWRYHYQGLLSTADKYDIGLLTLCTWLCDAGEIHPLADGARHGQQTSENSSWSALTPHNCGRALLNHARVDNNAHNIFLKTYKDSFDI